MTHEEYIHEVRKIALLGATPDEREKLNAAKLVYGLGTGAYRGRCSHGTWTEAKTNERHAIVEIAASAEESPLQLAGTTLHELGHVLAPGGHHAAWRRTCERLGLCNVKATGQVYDADAFAPAVFAAITRLSVPIDGIPAFCNASGSVQRPPSRSCTSGIGTRGGTSRGVGSGSRLRLFVCACNPPVKARVSHDAFHATCEICKTAFKRG